MADVSPVTHETKDLPTDAILTHPNNITVRRYRPKDAPSLSAHGNNKAIWNNLRNRMPHPYLEHHAKYWIDLHSDPSTYIASGPYNPSSPTPAADLTIVGSGPPLPINYAIVIDGEAVGSIGLQFGDAADVYARTAEIGYWLSQSHWGKGVMALVVPAFVDWSWRTFGVLVRLNAEVAETNPASKKTLERAGFVVEGTRKWAFVKNGLLCDDVLMGMLRPGAVEDDGDEDGSR